MELCYLAAYVRTEDEQYKIWVPKRAATKATWPGYLDNSVAGGITTGDSPLETLIRECGKLIYLCSRSLQHVG